MSPTLPLLLISASVAAPVAPPQDWAAALRQDATAVHDDVAANHPGPVDPANLGFAAANDIGLAKAIKISAQVHDYPGYWFALKAYVAGFDDGHMNLSPLPAAPVLPSRWPGFLTAFDATGAQRVVVRADAAPLPVGATLVGCDGKPAERVAADNVGAYQGRWQLSAMRRYAGGTLFVDQGNPFITVPKRCTFLVEGRSRAIALDWRAIARETLAPYLAETTRRLVPPIAATTLPDGTRWYTLSGFDTAASSDSAKKLPPLIAAMKADRSAIATAPAIVLDLRGNNGGSSDWSDQIAQILWGQAAIDRLASGAITVEWRASPANLKTMVDGRNKQGSNASPEIGAWFGRTISGMSTALAGHAPLWRAPGEVGIRSSEAPPPALAGPVYFLTDWGCGSACLDAADLWSALGAIQIGQETAADTLYMDIRRDALPSGFSRIVVPMKVYRGRKRGSNVSLRPIHAFTGDMRDTAMLQSWVATLPERASRPRQADTAGNTP